MIMNIELKKQRNDLLNRTNVLAKITSVKTPGRKEILLKVAATLGVDENLVVVDNIEQNFGEHICVAYLKVYDDIKTLKEVEAKYKIKRCKVEEVKEDKKDEPVKEEKKDEQVKEEKKDEQVKEEKKDEPVKEEKKDEPVKEEKKDEPVKEEKKDEPVKEEKKDEPVKEDKKEEKQ